jgi:hypothetical protein
MEVTQALADARQAVSDLNAVLQPKHQRARNAALPGAAASSSSSAAQPAPVGSVRGGYMFPLTRTMTDYREDYYTAPGEGAVQPAGPATKATPSLPQELPGGAAQPAAKRCQSLPAPQRDATGRDGEKTGKHYELRMLSGELLDPSDDFLSRRIYTNTTMGGLLPRIADLLGWPASHVPLIVGQQTFVHSNFFSERSTERLQSLVGEQMVLRVTVVKLPPPESMSPTVCLCDFDGCCVQGRPTCSHLDQAFCGACGHNALCRSNECLCDFDGCCLQGRPTCSHLDQPWCGACGHNASCRSGSCGHACCSRATSAAPHIVRTGFKFMMPPREP